MSPPRSSSFSQDTRPPPSMTFCPSASRKNDLPVPAGPQMARFSFRPTHSSVDSACCVGTGIDDTSSSQDSTVLPVGNPACFRRVANIAADRPRDSSTNNARTTSTGSHRCAFAVANNSGARLRAYGIFNRRISASTSVSRTGAWAETTITAHPRPQSSTVSSSPAIPPSPAPGTHPHPHCDCLDQQPGGPAATPDHQRRSDHRQPPYPGPHRHVLDHATATVPRPGPSSVASSTSLPRPPHVTTREHHAQSSGTLPHQDCSL